MHLYIFYNGEFMGDYTTVRMHNNVKDFVFKWNEPLDGATSEQTLMKMALVLNEIGLENVCTIYEQKVKSHFPKLFRELGINDARFTKNEEE